jgi:hypothetical protein
MHKRTATLALLLAIVAVSALLMPFAEKFSKTYAAGDVKDADHMIKPMLSMLEESPQKKANVPVEAMMELEDAWAIEDTREESADGHLVSGMRWKDRELGFDAQSNTFYCTLGMDGGDDWPEIALFAEGAEGTENLRVAWIDDYAYDYRSDAIRDGYRYELLAYTDDAYEYIGVVFTGLPIVSMRVQGGTEALGEDYIDIVLEGYPATDYLNNTRRPGNYSFMEVYWGPDYADPYTFTDPFRLIQKYAYIYMADGLAEETTVDDPDGSVDRLNRYWKNVVYDEMANAANLITDDLTERYTQFANAEAWLIENAYVIPYCIAVPGYEASLLNPYEAQYAPFGVSENRYKYQWVYEEPISMELYNQLGEQWEIEREARLAEAQ